MYNFVLKSDIIKLSTRRFASEEFLGFVGFAALMIIIQTVYRLFYSYVAHNSRFIIPCMVDLRPSCLFVTSRNTYIHTYIGKYSYIHTQSYIQTDIHTYIHTYIRTYIYTYIHTYIVRNCMLIRYDNTKSILLNYRRILGYSCISPQ
jgi:hypothetical protein